MIAKVFVYVAIFHISTAFNIISNTQNAKTLKRGQTLTLLCKSDASWEYCDWIHKGKDDSPADDKHCKMEWKYAKSAVQVTECHKELSKRVRRIGNYKNHECGLEVSAVTLQDGGVWECQMEEYVSGNWGSLYSGTRHTRSFDVEVKRRLVTTTTTTTTAPIIVSTTTPAVTTSEKVEAITTTMETPEVTEMEVERENEAEISEEEDIVMREDIAGQEDTTVPLIDLEEEYSLDYSGENNDNFNVSVASLKEMKVEEDSTGGIVVGVVVAVVALVLVAVGGALFWLKKRRSTDVLTLQKIKEESGGGTNAFLEEAEYSMSAGFTNLNPPQE